MDAELLKYAAVNDFIISDTQSAMSLKILSSVMSRRPNLPYIAFFYETKQF